MAKKATTATKTTTASKEIKPFDESKMELADCKQPAGQYRWFTDDGTRIKLIDINAMSAETRAEYGL